MGFSISEDVTDILRWTLPSPVAKAEPATHVTPREAAVILNVGRDHIDDLVEKDRIVAEKRGRRFAVPLTSVLDHRLRSGGGES